ncbi:MAG: HAD family phosphatase [Bacteroidales bacterium]|nr:HAD family phosphatase [Bacteroidales bacterium]
MKISLPENIDHNSFTNIIFDWGGVITELDFEITNKMFSNLGLRYFKSFFSKAHQIDILMDFELGKVTPEEFRNEMKRHVEKETSFNEINNAWNSVLRETPVTRIKLLKRLKINYNLYLLSNTNKIHTDFYNDKLRKEYGDDHNSLFIKAYYSYHIGFRKPDIRIFKHVIADSNLDPDKTIFIDDTEMHVDAAVKAGLHAFHLFDGLDIVQLFKDW